MKNWIKKTMVAAALVVAAQSVAFAQNIGFSINDRDNALPQLCYRIDVSNGAATEVGDLVDNITGANAVAEYEGLASVGSVLYGVSEFDPALGNPLERANIATISPEPASNPAGGECRRAIIGQSGDGAANTLFGTEAGSAYRSQDGFIYTVYGDDLTVGPRGEIMRLYTNSPTNGRAVFVGDVRLDTPTGAAIYVDGLAIDSTGAIFGSDGRGIAGQPESFYRINLPRVADPNNPGNFVVTATRLCTLPASNEDTGLAFDFANSRFFILYEGATPSAPAPRVQQITAASGACVLGTENNLNPLPIAGDFEAFDIPRQTVR